MVRRNLGRIEVEYLGGRCGMDVEILAECTDQSLVAGQMRHDPQLDLGIVSGQQHMTVGRNEGLSYLPSLRGTDRDVLQVGIGRRQPARRGDGLVVRGMYAPGALRDLTGKFVGVGALQLADTTVIENDLRQFVFGGEFLEHVLGRGRLALRRLSDHRETQLLEQDFLQLLRRAEVEPAAGQLVSRLFELRHPAF